MVFHSLEYLLFLPIVVALYFCIPFRHRWALLLLASYYFYAAWRIDFVFLLLISTGTDYLTGLWLEKTKQPHYRKYILAISLSINLGLLFIFKYVETLWEMLKGLYSYSFQADVSHLPEFDIILPLGISFYTFQTLSYTIDVYRKRIPAEKHLGYFALYVAFFPQLLAGPIERAGHLLKEIRDHRNFDWHWVGPACFLILLGFAKKLVIANRLGRYLEPIIATPQDYSPLEVLLTPAAHVYQYYCDLSGYADIAIGSAMLLGIKLSRNFNRPFAADSTMRFWYSWHITVTGWFRDYLLRPLMKNGSVTSVKPVALIVTGLVIGIWHGLTPGWVVAGASVGLLSILEGKWLRWRVKRNIGPKNNLQRLIWSWMGRFYVWFIVFFLIGLPLTWADPVHLGQALQQIFEFGQHGFSVTSFQYGGNTFRFLFILLMIAALEIWQWLEAKNYTSPIIDSLALEIRWLLVTTLTIFILIFADHGQPGFLYFQF